MLSRGAASRCRGVKNRKARRGTAARVIRRGHGHQEASLRRARAAAPKAPARRKTPRKKQAESAGLDPQGCLIERPTRRSPSSSRRSWSEGGAVVGHYKDPLGGHAMVARRAADREGRAHAVPARPQRRAPQAPRRGHREDGPLPRSGDRHHRAREGRRLLDAQRAPSPRGDAAPRREVDHRARRADARGRVADPRAQHREGAQPQGALARGHPHLPRPARGGRRRGPRRASRSTSRTRRS